MDIKEEDKGAFLELEVSLENWSECKTIAPRTSSCLEVDFLEEKFSIQ